MSASLTDKVDAAAHAAQQPQGRYLAGPVLDFVCLGGASLALFPIALLLDRSWAPTVAITMLVMTNFVNHPHFIHSYQLFYRSILANIADRDLARDLRVRYAVAGFIVPVALCGFIAYAIGIRDIALLGVAANVMSFLVGWHYVKQGYGILMVDAVLKRRFFRPEEKKILLANAYVVWIVSWMSLNATLSSQRIWGIEYVLFGVPWPLVMAGWAAAAAAAIVVLVMLHRRHARGDGIPWIGMMAYGVSLYPWLAFLRIDLIWLLVVPSLHSLQYLVVVWRFETNRASAAQDAMEETSLPLLRSILRKRYQVRLFAFATFGIIIGFLLFWAVPLVLDTFVKFPELAGQSSIFLFTFWVFVNVHHYFIDNVIWRSQNPETRRFLFA